MGTARYAIRPSSSEDGERAVAIWRAAVEATHDFLPPEDLAAIDAEVREFLPQMPLWLAVDDADRPIAFMLLDDGHLEALFIDPAHAGSGVGRTLVAHALQLHPALTTDVNEQNPAALAFYEHLGFQRTGRSELDGQGRPFPLIHLRYQQVLASG
ncbi:putative acetyltransferase [Altererythrobacter atlanticus]|uniref:N-acetyltransferase YjaB n=1 Tax=Croceibacterium atlanticum TaxID=1267766 RepID=A0A0F7KW03_9SPHN|nr:acetyltransferase [Croceibacterium atlanticum]AKH42950.1 putative N-acetyltransferase YjaB [Croceibacterium atlanticum]MBB5734093.1 putative acetyltransferase [Croceibacterium atlanticum]